VRALSQQAMANTNQPTNQKPTPQRYSDDQASFKRAPRNPRATDILMACGGNPMDVSGLGVRVKRVLLCDVRLSCMPISLSLNTHPQKILKS
jgi:hypothetical protein